MHFCTIPPLLKELRPLFSEFHSNANRHYPTQGVGADNPTPYATVILPETKIRLAITHNDLNCPLVLIGMSPKKFILFACPS